MSPFRNCGPFTAGVILRMLPRHLIGLQLVLGVAVATTPLFAQQSPAPNRAQVYVDKYSELLSPLKEARFAYSGYYTRSRPTKGVAAKWESTGEFRVSVARKSFHCTSATQLVGVTGKPDFAPEDQGVEESLITPDTCLNVALVPKHLGVDPPFNVCVSMTKRRRGDEWSNELLTSSAGRAVWLCSMQLQNQITAAAGPIGLLPAFGESTLRFKTPIWIFSRNRRPRVLRTVRPARSLRPQAYRSISTSRKGGNGRHRPTDSSDADNPGGPLRGLFAIFCQVEDLLGTEGQSRKRFRRCCRRFARRLSGE